VSFLDAAIPEVLIGPDMSMKSSISLVFVNLWPKASTSDVSVLSFSIGGHQYYLDYTLAGQQIELSFDPDLVAFSCHNQAGEWLAHISFSGITFESLMGDLPANLPAL
jgi:hypothetical protein